MSKHAAAAAAFAILVSIPVASHATGPVWKGGQSLGTTQYTGIVDDANGDCAKLGLTVGSINAAVATFVALGKPYTEVINSTGGPIPGVSPIACTFPALPKATLFKQNTDGSWTAQNGTTASSSSTTCVTALGTFNLVSGNGSITFTGAGGANNYAQTSSVTTIVNPTGSLDYGLQVTTAYTQLQSQGNTICLLSTSALYLDTVK